MPQQRKLPAEVKENATRLLHMKANKKLIQQEISKETGKVVLLKDICNMNTAARRGRSRNNLDVAVQTLKDKYGIYAVHITNNVAYHCVVIGADVEIYSDTERNLQGIFSRIMP